MQLEVPELLAKQVMYNLLRYCQSRVLSRKITGLPDVCVFEYHSFVCSHTHKQDLL